MAIQHFGRFRDVTHEQAKLDKTVVKTLYRWGTTQESILVGRCKVRVDSDEWRSSLARLQEYGLVEVFERRRSRCVCLTAGDGQGWGMDLTCEAQVQEQADADKALADRLAAERKAARTK